MQMTLSYALTVDDFVEFQRGYMKHRKALTPRGQRGVGKVVLLVWLVLMAGLLSVNELLAWQTAPAPVVPGPAGLVVPPQDALGSWLRSVLPYLVIFIVMVCFVRWLMRSKYLMRQLAALGTRLGDARSAEITDRDITIREPGAVFQMEWRYFIRLVETPGVFILFVVPRMGHIIPKRAFASPADLEAFRAFGLAHIGNEPIGFPVEMAAK